MLVFVDLETGGLPAKNEKDMPPVLEVAAIITDNDLNEVSHKTMVVRHDLTVLQLKLNDWCLKTHGDSGLIDECTQAQRSIAGVQAEFIHWLEPYLQEAGSVDPETGELKLYRPPLCGNTVSFDRTFMQVFMPRFLQLFHYRNIDVSTLKELGKVWGIPEYKKEGGAEHRALDDIRHSIEELAYYRQFITLERQT